MASNIGLGFCFSAGIILRLSLFRSSLPVWLSLRPEISNPLTSWERATEGVALSDDMISPYTGDMFHETPLMLRLLSFMTKAFPNHIHYLFVLIDFLTGLVIVKIGTHFSRYLLQKQVSDVKEYKVGVDKILLYRTDIDKMKIMLVAMHFLNPYSIAICLGKSTAVFNNLFVFLVFMLMLQGKQFLCLLFIAIASYQSLYPLMLLVPAALYFHLRNNPEKKTFTPPGWIMSFSQTFIIGGILLGGLILASYLLEGSTKFIFSTWGFILSVPDLTPNLGVFWYFFTEMFEHFRVFFICVFQINAFLYTVPLAVKLRDQPVFLMYVLVALMSIFKSYPSYADVALYLTLLPMWNHVFSHMRNTFIVSNMFICCTVLSPILWHLWIYAGSANANFYFAIALTFSTAQIFLVTDLIFAGLRREYELRHGQKQILENGKEAQVVLD